MRINRPSVLKNLTKKVKSNVGKTYSKLQQKQHARRVEVRPDGRFRPPNILIGLFVLLLVVALIGIARDAGSYYGFRPFGFLEDIVAQVSGTATLSQTQKTGLIRGDTKIIDGYGRCQIINPNSRKPVKLVANAGKAGSQDIEGKGGLNDGFFISGGGAEKYTEFIEKNNLTMGYIVGMAMGPGDALGAISFIKDTVDAGMMPIVRLCYSGSCQFTSPSLITQFYTQINGELAGSDYEYIGTIGPNEPGTEIEMDGFGYAHGDYKSLINNTNSIAADLQEYRVGNGGNMYIAPAILNISNEIGDDAWEYLYGKSGAKIDPELYDYILGNAYNIGVSSVSGVIGADVVYNNKRLPGGKSVRDYIEDNADADLVFVFTEFGYMDGSVADLKQAYINLCEDETVDGISFFRPFQELEPPMPRQNPWLSINDARDMLDSCSELPKKASAKKSAWFNCNFDSCIYSSTDTKVANSDAKPQLLCSSPTGGASTNVSTSTTAPKDCNLNAFSAGDVNVLKAIHNKAGKDFNVTIKIGDSQSYLGAYMPGAINVAANGASTVTVYTKESGAEGKDTMADRFQSALKSNAATATIMLGTNDCGGLPGGTSQFKENLQKIGNDLANNGIIPILSTIPDRGPKAAACIGGTDSWNSVIRALANEKGWPLKDTNSIINISDLKPDDELHIQNYDCVNALNEKVVASIREKTSTVLGAETQSVSAPNSTSSVLGGSAQTVSFVAYGDSNIDAQDKIQDCKGTTVDNGLNSARKTNSSTGGKVDWVSLLEQNKSTVDNIKVTYSNKAVGKVRFDSLNSFADSISNTDIVGVMIGSNDALARVCSTSFKQTSGDDYKNTLTSFLSKLKTKVKHVYIVKLPQTVNPYNCIGNTQNWPYGEMPDGSCPDLFDTLKSGSDRRYFDPNQFVNAYNAAIDSVCNDSFCTAISAGANTSWTQNPGSNYLGDGLHVKQPVHQAIYNEISNTLADVVKSAAAAKTTDTNTNTDNTNTDASSTSKTNTCEAGGGQCVTTDSCATVNRERIYGEFTNCVAANQLCCSKKTVSVAATSNLKAVKANLEPKGVQLKVKCEGATCDVESQKTIQVWLPIKSLGSVNPVNSANLKSYTPACVELASLLNLGEYDAANQFAGKLFDSQTDSAAKTYPMPWLGSLINCLSELAKVEFAFQKDYTKISSSPGALTTASISEVKTDLTTKLGSVFKIGDKEVSLAKPISNASNHLYNLKQDGTNYIADEHAVCIVSSTIANTPPSERCYDGVNNIDLLKSIRFYSPLATPNSYMQPALCQNTNMIYLKNKDDYIPGPELVVSEYKKEYSGSRICWMYGRREEDTAVKNEMSASPGVDGVQCHVDPNYEVTTGCAIRNPVTKVCTQYQKVKCINLIPSKLAKPGIYDPTCDFNTGRCKVDVPEEAIEHCFIYEQQENDQIYIKYNDYAPIPKYTISEIYDALSTSYQKVQNELSMRYKKIVFRENLGWKSEVDSILRDKNVETNDKASKSAKTTIDVGQYLYSVNSDPACTNPDTVQFFDNKSARAKGDPVKKENQYYDWLGYLDVIQEWRMGYVNNTDLPAEQGEDNPFYGKDGEPNSERKTIYVGGISNQYSSFPLLTCDQVEFCKKYTKNGLVLKFQQDFGKTQAEAEKIAARYCPLDKKLDENTNLTCITDSGDNRFGDKLAEELCKRGYNIAGACEIYCPTQPSTDPVADAIKSTGKVEGVTCPVQQMHKCFQGPYGGYSHCAASDMEDLPLDLFPQNPNNPGVLDANRNFDVVAPENGIVTLSQKISLAGLNIGYRVDILGSKSGISYHILHLSSNGLIQSGSKVNMGEKIGVICTTDCSYGYANAHTHINAYYKGISIDPYALYGDILGCNAVAPTTGMKNGSSASTGMCQTASATLNDLACKKSIPVLDNNILVGIFKDFASKNVGGTDAQLEQSQTQSQSQTTTSGNSYVSSTTSTNNCSGAQCPILKAKNGVEYPACPSVGIEYPLCGGSYNYVKIDQVFGSGEFDFAKGCGTNLSNIQQAMNSKTEVVSFLGMDRQLRVNKKIVGQLKLVEKEIQKLAISHSGADYIFKSGSYQFNTAGALYVRLVRDTDPAQCIVSPHSWGTAIDLNIGTNAFQSNSCSLDMPPEVVYAFEKYGFRWGGRYLKGSKFDPMHFEYCSDTFDAPIDDSTPYDLVGNNCPVVNDTLESIVVDYSDSMLTKSVTKEDILKLCSPKTSGYVDISVDQVYQVYNAFKSASYQKTPERTARIQEILDAAKKTDINPAYLFGFWFTEGGYLGDGVAGDGTTNLRRNAFGFDFGCGLRASCGIAFRDGSTKPTQEQYNEGFARSLACATKTDKACNLQCSYQGISSTTTVNAGGYGTQQPGLGAFLECYGPLVDNNAFFAKKMVAIYDAFFPPTGNNPARRMESNNCKMKL